MNFSAYLESKKIDEQAFASAEPVLFQQWEHEFAQMHPNSFTVQKLNLINPLRRKYVLKTPSSTTAASTEATAKPKAAIRPKPKFN